MTQDAGHGEQCVSDAQLSLESGSYSVAVWSCCPSIQVMRRDAGGSYTGGYSACCADPQKGHGRGRCNQSPTKVQCSSREKIITERGLSCSTKPGVLSLSEAVTNEDGNAPRTKRFPWPVAYANGMKNHTTRKTSTTSPFEATIRLLRPQHGSNFFGVSTPFTPT